MEIKRREVRRLGADFLLLCVTFFWGVTFVVVKDAIAKVGVFVFLSQRFILASIILLCVCLVLRRPLTMRFLKQGMTLGIFLFGGFAFQTIALLYTSASNTAFLTGLNVVFVPIIGAMIFRQVITRNMKTGVVLATVGLFFLCTNGTWSFNGGDILAGLCAVCIALHVIFTGEYARKSDIYWLTVVQLGTVALFSVVGAFLLGDGGSILVWYPDIVWALVICVLLATVFAFLIQTSMQRFTSPTHTALIFCMEPVFAAAFAYVMIHERWGIWGLIGAVLILAGMVVSEISSINFFFMKKPEDTYNSIVKT
jgi:drug/metabolite transporter (DMT)-like permease